MLPTEAAGARFRGPGIDGQTEASGVRRDGLR